MHIIFESVLMLLTANYQNRSTIVEATAGQSWRIFLRHSVEPLQYSFIEPQSLLMPSVGFDIDTFDYVLLSVIVVLLIVCIMCM